MRLKEVQSELEKKLSAFVHSPALRSRVMNVVVPFVSRHFVPDYMWLVERFYGTSDESEIIYLGSTQGMSLQMIRDEFCKGVEPDTPTSFALLRIRVNPETACKSELVSVFSSTGAPVMRETDETEVNWMFRAAFVKGE